MIPLRSVALCTFAIAVGSPAQTTPPPAQIPTVAASLALEKNHILAGEKPWAILTIENIAHSSSFSTSSRFYRVHVEGKQGEPPKTELYRRMLGDFRPGDGPDLPVTVVADQNIAPGSSATRAFDLTEFYDLSVPGKYTVYMEFLDERSGSKGPSGEGNWMRTNTEDFEIETLPR